MSEREKKRSLTRHERMELYMDLVEKYKIIPSTSNFTLLDSIYDYDLKNNVEEKILPVIKQIQEIESNRQESPNNYSEDIMQSLRCSVGIDKYNTNGDYIINQWPKQEAFNKLLDYNGLINFGPTIIEWVKEIFNVDLNEVK